jgi:hypothetical protein
MQKLSKLPLLFLCIASLMGLLLRWHQYAPVDGLVFSYWLHAHSHVMFLGWILNALSIGYVHYFILPQQQRIYRVLIIWLNVLVAIMLVAFPLQGYAGFSIVISTLYTILAAFFGYRFLRDTKSRQQSLAIGFARWSFIFYFIASLAPFAIGILSATGQGQTQAYYLAVYFFLHFLYNGAFTCGVLSLLYQLLQTKGIEVDEGSAQRFKFLLCLSCIPAYVLSTLWIKPPFIFNFIGFIAAILQLIAFYYFVHSIKALFTKKIKSFSWTSRTVLFSAILCFLLKLVLQLISAFPPVAMLAYEVRYFVIGYLHLVLLGMLTFLLLFWYQEEFEVKALTRTSALFLIICFVLSEVLMLLLPLLTTAIDLNFILVLMSVGIFLSFCWFFIAFSRLASSNLITQ